MPNHTLQPSHSLLTEERVFIPRTCSTCLADEFAIATALPDFACPRSLVRLLRIMCEKGRNETARVFTEGRNWRRAPEEAPKTVRRENMAAGFGFDQSSRKMVDQRLCRKLYPLNNTRYRGAGARLMFGSEGSLLRSQMLAGASVSPAGRGVSVCDWSALDYKQNDSSRTDKQ